jgi:hypothetical protein
MHGIMIIMQPAGAKTSDQLLIILNVLLRPLISSHDIIQIAVRSGRTSELSGLVFPSSRGVIAAKSLQIGVAARPSWISQSYQPVAINRSSMSISAGALTSPEQFK